MKKRHKQVTQLDHGDNDISNDHSSLGSPSANLPVTSARIQTPLRAPTRAPRPTRVFIIFVSFITIIIVGGISQAFVPGRYDYEVVYNKQDDVGKYDRKKFAAVARNETKQKGKGSDDVASKSFLVQQLEQDMARTRKFLADRRRQRRQNMDRSDVTYTPYPFRVLCTTRPTRMENYGSYRIRCIFFQQYCQHYFPNVTIDLKDQHEQQQQQLVNNSSPPPPSSKAPYNATIFIKSFPPHRLDPKLYGKVFVDVVDAPWLFNAARAVAAGDIPKKANKFLWLEDGGILVQNKPMRKFFVSKLGSKIPVYTVTHWFNSIGFADNEPDPVGPLPDIVDFTRADDDDDDDGNNNNNNNNSIMRVATIWDYDQPCPSPLKNNPSIRYQCIEESYHIWEWFHKYYHQTSNTTDEEQRYLQEWVKQKIFAQNHTSNNTSGGDDKDDLLSGCMGEGYLYRVLFQQFHVLVVLPKDTDGGIKRMYHNYQRIVSQMRSGVPVLLDCRTPHHRAFCQKYAVYSAKCTFNTDRKLWEKLAEMYSSMQLRQFCQTQGIEITKDFTPQKIITTYLTTLGLPIPSGNLSASS